MSAVGEGAPQGPGDLQELDDHAFFARRRDVREELELLPAHHAGRAALAELDEAMTEEFDRRAASAWQAVVSGRPASRLYAVEDAPDAPDITLEEARQMLPGWDIWHADGVHPGSRTWSAMPEGADCAPDGCSGLPALTALVSAAREYQAHLAEHITATRAGLRRATGPAPDAARRDVLTARMCALQKLRAALADGDGASHAGAAGAQVAEWRASGYPYKLIAAAMAEWAASQDRGTVLPGNEFFAGDIGIVAGATPWRKAKALLADVGVLYRDGRCYRVA